MRKLKQHDDNSMQFGDYGTCPSSVRGALVVLGCVLALLLAGGAKAEAQPTSGAMQLRVVPIPVDLSAAHGATYPGTGNVLGEGYTLEANVQITGNEYGGFPPPLTSVQAYAPAGEMLDTQAFPICSQAILESHEVNKCPQNSLVASGSVSGVVSFGGERVHEIVSLRAFLDGTQKVGYYAEGTSPVSLEVLGSGTIVTPAGDFSHELEAAVPLVETVPEAPYAVVQSARLMIGGARMQGSHLIPLMKLPKSCPKGGMLVRLRMGFLTGSPVQIDSKLPCPTRR